MCSSTLRCICYTISKDQLQCRLITKSIRISLLAPIISCDFSKQTQEFRFQQYVLIINRYKIYECVSQDLWCRLIRVDDHQHGAVISPRLISGSVLDVTRIGSTGIGDEQTVDGAGYLQFMIVVEKTFLLLKRLFSR